MSETLDGKTLVLDQHGSVSNWKGKRYASTNFLTRAETPRKTRIDTSRIKCKRLVGGKVRKEDYVCQSTQGKIGYRNEQLATSDRGVILLRKLLMEAIATVQKGGVPMEVVAQEKAAEIITLDAFRRILPKSELNQVMRAT